ncbi:hypothetical protein TREMEDRAFT_62350 [Tremella mesenterica DSM 1558]|uniref:uncharacterized protein n=1 Tax=Tremella mesenterica (strain ATCC 24925 / CBS 8224 / DSM 1558 / NBRC 9311 / NRRL Y-6157 / RJB 2259-6 / UBC 559-6) TaxID=578456 RepID=UPI0003F4A2B4|nr:uncharacterized protein TREMEDRAFT_62350 [Tremella mesenterica DSM 1558]EIW69489.1 hypothetical protein TREMEDRAFT_62350 [Tremella mesenterica DSM 1558]
MLSRVPDIPGTLLEDQETHYHLSERVSQLCGLSNNRFPGSQPVSFTVASLEMLEKMDFWVCEKSDGVRVLVFIVYNKMSQQQEVWLIDRKQRYFRIQDLHFPHWEKADQPLQETLLDGEMVLDYDSRTNVETLRLYAFDCLVLNGENIMQKPMAKRYGRLKVWVIEPWQKALKAYPEWRESLPFDVVAKEQELSYHIKQVLNVHIPRLQHGHDGLIFTCAESQYVSGTDEKILKWKPPSENSIDFKLELRFPPDRPGSSQPDFYAKPEFHLYTWLGKEEYEFYDIMDVDDDEWERMKETNEQYDDRIIEVCWDFSKGTWKMMRLRDDKPHANHKSIMEKILVSIEDGVEIEALLAHTDSIRHAWKSREAHRNPNSHSDPSQSLPQSKSQPTLPPTTPGIPTYPATPGNVNHPITPAGWAPVTPGPTPGHGLVPGLKR